jgi:HAE1 family hydrophobic/amphiphilic exporter-1
MATAVVIPIENALSGVSGIDQLQSNINSGSASITVRFVLERDLEDAANAVREKVAGAMRRVPPQVLPPIVQKQDPDASPVMSIVLSSTSMSLRTLSEIADKQVKRALESVDGVGEVTMNGDLPREVHVIVDIEKLNAHGLSIDEVRDAVQAENVEVPGGTLEQGSWEVGLRTLGRIDATDQFKNIIVKTVNDTPIRLADIGSVEDTTARQRSAYFRGDGNPAIQLDIRRASGENTIKVTDAIKLRLRTVRQALPKDASLVITNDDSEFIKASVDSLEEHLLYGSLLASLVVVFFIRNIRAVLISALAIPASIVATFTLMRYMDFTLNNMTLLGLTLAVGIVIDDAIVVLENIFRYIEEKGVTPFDAAIQATREVALPVMATTLSLVVIFVPVAFMTGYAARFIYPFGWTMAFAIMVSMFVSFTLTPMLSSRFLRAADAERDSRTKDSRAFRAIDRWYTGALHWSMAHPGLVIGASILTVLSTIPLNRALGRTFVPEEDMGQITVHLDAPQGTSLEGTIDAATSVAKSLSNLEGVREIHYLAGAQRTAHFHVFLYLEPIDERSVTQADVMAEIRRILSTRAGFSPIVTARSALGGGEGNFPISASLQGPEVGKLYEYSQTLLARAQQTPSLIDVKTNFTNANPEIHVAVDRARAADLGVRMSTAGDLLRLMVAGDDQISTYREGAEQYPVKIRVLESQRRDMAAIGKLTVPSSSGEPVRIDNIARFERGYGPNQIRRVNRQYSIDLQSDVAPGHALDEASNDTRRLIAGLQMPAGYGGRLAGQTQILDETTANLMMAIGLASIFVYLVLAAQFESFVQPIIIMLVLPVSVPFALLTIWGTGRTLNLWSALGILLLFGIVKKNSILQVDYANVLRAQGRPLQDAIIEASRTRLRPILMTTAAIIAGLIPTALGLGIGGTQRSAIATTIIGGQSLCLLLTLLLVPVAYAKLEWLEESGVNKTFKAWVARLVKRKQAPVSSET